MPRVTVIIPTYNWAPVLPFAIGSVLDQSFADLEVLVVGDGCTDESAEVVGSIGDDRVRWHNLATNTGHQWGPDNEGLARARGELIAYLGHDDLWLPGHLDALVGCVDETSAKVVHGSCLMVDPRDAPRRWPGPGWSYQPGGWIPPTTLLHDRELARSLGGWRPPSVDTAADPDADLWARMAARSVPRHVDRLTSIKLSAASRREVYRRRPAHEQAWWLERIRAAADPEEDIGSAAGQAYPLAVDEDLALAPMGQRLGWSVRTRWRRLRGRPAVTSAERMALHRRSKGLDPR